MFSQSQQYEKDAKPHSSVQGWSRGDIFPAVICDVERYDAQGNLVERCAKVLFKDAVMEVSSPAHAEAVARQLLAHDAACAAFAEKLAAQPNVICGVLAGEELEAVRVSLAGEEQARKDSVIGMKDRPASDLGYVGAYVALLEAEDAV